MFSSLVIALIGASSIVNAAPVPVASASDFHLQNGIDAQALNAKFTSLASTDSCTDGEEACVSGSFAQCVTGAWALTPCTGGTTCVALPLVNKAGTSITCDTQADAETRIAATGATGGLTGFGSGASSSPAPTSAAANAAAVATTAAAAPASSASASSTSSDFHLQNGLDAQTLNAKFTTLASTDACSDGDQACVSGSFAQCVAGKWTLSPCSGGLTCVALPLVNKAGTSVTCDTQSDAETRIAATGATGGLTGSGSASSSSATATSADTNADADVAASLAAPAATTSASASASSSSSDFHLQNGKDAQALNAKFASLTSSDSCSDGEQACVSGSFAQCVGGTWTVSQCAAGTSCFALPLVNKAGTSLTCDSQSDAEARIAATGATGGLTGTT
ncbi:hypothetical protein PUNSTDRAFT_120434 [Punctularia strigosozonata HHB-11173 SS5]|uniref:uncharacterized protein n=1 Tax=Punctularia strigosozonata (strain HHB-11173) TaxID=741275 RepID=UPI0004417C7D|nr:uncharacterized protein PUNSTDRAFT_120434 [Punctularia strigosozonata HHB-11173 SS5]EIN08910.1 hypothetical protein PUNSTDRAFT_120434 [Punctularia strigosozonata HHB-11173 SS5]